MGAACSIPIGISPYSTGFPIGGAAACPPKYPARPPTASPATVPAAILTKSLLFLTS